jgi:hypothetical protein
MFGVFSKLTFFKSRSNLDRGINTAPPFLLVSYVQKKGTNRMFSKYNCVIIEFLGPGLS